MKPFFYHWACPDLYVNFLTVQNPTIVSIASLLFEWVDINNPLHI